MLTTLLLAVVPAAAQVSVPELDLTVRVSATRFAAVNPTDRPELVFVFDRLRGHRATLVVPARGTVDLRFPAGTLHGLEIVVATRIDAGTVATSPWSLETLALAPEGVWFEVENGRERTGWNDPTSCASGRSAPNTMCAPPTHVPVVSPHDGESPDAPPRLERRPLPPV